MLSQRRIPIPKGILASNLESEFSLSAELMKAFVDMYVTNWCLRSWWLNLACCYRDGIVGSMVDDLTKGPYGVTAIPLLAGEEIESSVPDCFTYHRVGPIQDMYVSIMGKLGQTQVRVLRGYKLDSPNAPKAGIRYDGL